MYFKELDFKAGEAVKWSLSTVEAGFKDGCEPCTFCGDQRGADEWLRGRSSEKAVKSSAWNQVSIINIKSNSQDGKKSFNRKVLLASDLAFMYAKWQMCLSEKSGILLGQNHSDWWTAVTVSPDPHSNNPPLMR